uniref:Ig-like domain-containing protein n=1 Tax=Equus caballus TaxID=9796 RepID=A0A9L0TGY5_HORSE
MLHIQVTSFFAYTFLCLRGQPWLHPVMCHVWRSHCLALLCVMSQDPLMFQDVAVEFTYSEGPAPGGDAGKLQEPALPGVLGAVWVTQEASVSGSVRQKVTLSCAGNSNNGGIFDVGWYQISHGAPKTVMLRSSWPSGIPARLSSSKSGNTAYLTISGLQPEDEADYYCSAWDDSISNNTVLRTHGEPRPKHAPFLVITSTLPLTNRED